MDYQEMIRLNQTLSEERLQQLSKVYYGHELWMESACVRGNNVSCRLRYGHNMAIDGVAPNSYVNTFVYVPGQTRKAKTNEKAGSEDWTLSCPKTEDGDYTFYTDSSSVWCKDAKGKWTMGPKSSVKNSAYSGAYQLVAKKIFSIGSKGDFKPTAHTMLDILPSARKLKVGEEIAFKVKYEKKNVTKCQMKAYCKESKKEIMADIIDGKVAIKIEDKGTWMFLVRLKDESKKVADEYDETVFVTTLVMETG